MFLVFSKRVNPTLPMTVPHEDIVRLPHRNDVLDLQKGDTVFARYPDTTALYKATVVQDVRIQIKK